MKEKNKILMFISACIPGCGQMYQGYMKRGTSLMLAFCALIAVCSFLYLGELALFLPVLWLYSFFDTYNLRAALRMGYDEDDTWLFDFFSLDTQRFGSLMGKHHSLVGWALVLGGLYALYDTVLRGPIRNLLYSIGMDWLADTFFYTLPRMVGILLIIGLGVWFIRGPKQPEEANDFTSFTPPPSASPSGAAPNDGAPTYKSVIDAVVHGPQDTAGNAPKEDRYDGE